MFQSCNHLEMSKYCKPLSSIRKVSGYNFVGSDYAAIIFIILKTLQVFFLPQRNEKLAKILRFTVFLHNNVNFSEASCAL